MNIKERLRNFFGTEEEYEYDYGYDYNEEFSQPEVAVQETKQQSSNNVVNLTKIESSISKVILAEPKSYNEVQDIADNILNKRSVVINLQQVDRVQAKRIVDFLSGTVYAVKGDIQKLGISTFFCAPENVELTGQISVDEFDEDEIEHGW